MTDRTSDTPPPADDEGAKAPETEGAKAPETKEPSKEGPGSLDWWLKDGPDSPIAADIEEPEKHL